MTNIVFSPHFNVVTNIFEGESKSYIGLIISYVGVMLLTPT